MVERMIQQALKGNPCDFNGVAINDGYFRHEDAVALMGLNRRDLKKFRSRGIVPRPILDLIAEALGVRFVGKDGRGGMNVRRLLELLHEFVLTMEGPKRSICEWLLQRLAASELGAPQTPQSTSSLVRMADLFGARD